MQTYCNAYGLRHKIPIQKTDEEIKKEVSLTIPNKETTLEEALRRYQPDSMRKVRTYYEENGIELPQFEKMDRLEQLMLCAQVREKTKEATEKKNKLIEKTKKAEIQAEIDRKVKKLTESKPKNNEGSNTV